MKKRKKNHKSSKSNMGLVEHLSELRKRLFIIISVLIVATLVSFNFSNDIVKILVELAESIGYKLVFLSPGELFKENIRLSIVIGMVLSSPVILYEIWSFIRPGLKKSENIVVFLSLFAGFLFFLIGSLFAYYIAMPLMLNFFISVDQYQSVAATISIQNYLSFIMSTLLTFGIIFEMPVISVLLTQLGLIIPEWLTKSRRIVIVVIFVIGAIITPSDIISQVLVSIPMFILFEISVVLCKIVYKGKVKRETARYE